MKRTPKLPDLFLYQSYSEELFDTRDFTMYLVVYHVGNSCRVSGKFFSLDAALKYMHCRAEESPDLSFDCVRYSLYNELVEHYYIG